MYYRVLRLKRLGQKFLAGAQQERQWILYTQPEKQGLTGFLRHVGEASSYGTQMSDKDNSDACNVLLFQV